MPVGEYPRKVTNEVFVAIFDFSAVKNLCKTDKF